MPKTMSFQGAVTPAKRTLEITSFAGIDLSSAPADIDKRRSPDAPNMMPDALGNPVKRPGYESIGNYGGRINGSFSIGEHRVIHAGESLFIDGEKVWEGMNDEISTAQIINGKLYIFDGNDPMVCDGSEAHPLSDDAYIPTVLISKNADECEKETVLKGDGMSTEFTLEHSPETVNSVTVDGVSTEYSVEGDKIKFETAPEENAEIKIKAFYIMEPGGSGLEEFNLISRKWKESFYCDTGTEKKFTLSQKGLSERKIRAWVMDENGEMQERFEGTDFTADRENGKILFNEPVLKAPITGTDNVIIEADKFFPEYESRINFCRKSITFDFGGTSSRIFLCGNPAEPNRDHWCAANDPTYWPDTFYSELEGEIAGYSVIADRLATYISDPKDGRSIAIRNIKVDEEGNVSFPIERYIQGEKAFAANGFVFMDKEQLFLTERGVYALTTEDISGEKYTQNRSFYINKALCAESGLEKAFCGRWKQFYLISLNGKIYLLDTGQRSYQRGEPLSSFQYECYLWSGIDARILWEEKGELFFGDNEGNICRFAEGRYSDDGKAIEAYWTVPDFAGDSFWKNKTVRMVAIEAAAFPQNEVRLEVMKNGFWEVLQEWKSKISFFSWNAINWENFTWSGNARPRTLTLKTKIKKFDKVSFRLVCDKADMAFGLYGFALEYTEGGRYKK